MSLRLFRLGQYIHRHRAQVVLAWVAILGLLVIVAIGFGGKINNEFVVPETESQDAIDLLQQTFPQASGASAQIVFKAPSGLTVQDEQVRSDIQSVSAAGAQVDQVVAVLDPFTTGAISPDGTIAYSQVQFEVTVGEIEPTVFDDLVETATAASSDTQIEYGGEIFQGNPGLGPSEVIGVVIAFVILAVTLGSLFAAGLPLLAAIGGVAVSLALTFAVSDLVDISSTAPLLAVMIGLAVGIDYSLFIVSRYRSERASGHSVEDSIGKSLGTAGSAVIFAGLTVVIALASLSIVGIPFLSVMGLAAALAVVVAVAVAVTLLPALLSYSARRLDRAHRAKAVSAPNSLLARWGRLAVRKPLLTVLGVVAVLAVMAIPVKDLHLALPDNGSSPPETTQRQAHDLISAGFGPGFNGPLLIVVDHTQLDNAEAALSRIGADLAGIEGMAVVSPPQPSPSGQVSLLQATPTTGPSDRDTESVVDAVRALSPQWADALGVTTYVTGFTAAGIDISELLGQALLPFAFIVVGLSLVVLLLVFRSIVIPAKAAIGFLLSVMASFGAVVAVFQWGWLADVFEVQSTEATIGFLPIILMAVLFGLAMDYQVFLVSRMREQYVRTKDAAASITAGFNLSARIVTAAALIMFSVFGSFVLNEDPSVKPIAFALAVGILLDAFLVRMTLMPAALALLGERAWYIPTWLDRRIPDIDVEGTKLDSLQLSTESTTKDSPARRALSRALRDFSIERKSVRVQCRTLTGEVEVSIAGALKTSLRHAKGDSEEVLAWRFAQLLQTDLEKQDETTHLPPCPGHPHSLVPSLSDQQAYWACPEGDGGLAIRVGEIQKR